MDSKTITQPDTDRLWTQEITVRMDSDGDLEIGALDSGSDEIIFDRVRARELYDAIGDVMDFSPASVPAPVKARPRGAQEYKGNGNHKWEEVSVDAKGAGHTYRLRVPGGWLYRTVSTDDRGYTDAQSSCFVPMPDTVGYAV